MNAGTFVKSYTIMSELADAPVFSMNLVVSTHNLRVSGQGQIAGDDHAYSRVDTLLLGEFSRLVTAPGETSILISMDGYSPSEKGTDGKNVTLRMVLDSNWSVGNVNYSYINNDEQWQSVKDAKVTTVTEYQSAEILQAQND